MNKVQRLLMSLDSLLIESIEETLPIIEGLQRVQMGKGERSDNRRISDPPGKPYTPRYARKKGLPRNKVNLKLSGDFWDAITTKIVWPDYIEIDSTDFKTKYLEPRYSSLIFGLNDENLETYIKALTPVIQRKINELLP
jgi:hypothetical protein